MSRRRKNKKKWANNVPPPGTISAVPPPDRPPPPGPPVGTIFASTHAAAGSAGDFRTNTREIIHRMAANGEIASGLPASLLHRQPFLPRGFEAQKKLRIYQPGRIVKGPAIPKELKALISTVGKEPCADAPRAVLADWLQDHPEPWREQWSRVIIGMCSAATEAAYDFVSLPPFAFLANPDGSPPAQIANRTAGRWQKITLNASDSDEIFAAIVEGGFISAVYASFNKWGQIGPELIRWHPHVEVRITDPNLAPYHNDTTGDPRPFYWSAERYERTSKLGDYGMLSLESDRLPTDILPPGLVVKTKDYDGKGAIRLRTREHACEYLRACLKTSAKKISRDW